MTIEEELDLIIGERWTELRNEIFEVQAWAKEKEDSHLRKRVFVRTLAANAESCIYMLSHVMLSLSTPSKLGHAEYSILKEIQYELDETGNPKEKQKNYPAIARWRLLVRLMEKLAGTNYWKVDFSNNGFNNFQKLFKVRDRIVHPKMNHSIEIEDDEMSCCVDGFTWFIENFQGICKVP